MPKHYRPPGKKKEGNAAKFISRTKALRHLQISLSHFRHLCILKGIFPREPKKKFEGNHKTYYHTKDIAFLSHEPLIEKFRQKRVHLRKIKKARAKKNKELLERLKSRPPTYKLDRLILERYPTFADSLADLDDCLSMVHLFAALPAVEGERIQVERIHKCQRLSHEWQAYISRTHSLRKTYISVKGIYYQAEVQGQPITWLTPHAMQQVVPDDVDYNAMLIFLEFYEALLGFVNFRLYQSIMVKYPPVLDPELEALSSELYALCTHISTVRRTRSGDARSGCLINEIQMDNETETPVVDESEVRLAQLQHQLPANEPGTLMNLEDSSDTDQGNEDTKECRNLFRNLKFFLSREVPRESLLFIIPAFGGVVSWEGDGSPFRETDEDITHQIADRPTQRHMFLSREYIQPQWVYDSVNARFLLPTYGYLIGKLPPPHISPFVDNEMEGYVPDYAESIKQLKAGNVLPILGIDNHEMDAVQNSTVVPIDDIPVVNEAAQKQKKRENSTIHWSEDGMEDFETWEEGMTCSGVDSVKKNATVEENHPEDELRHDKALVSRRRRGLIEAIEISQQRKEEKINILKQRKEKRKKAAQ